MKNFIPLISVAVILLAGGTVLAQDNLGPNIMRYVKATNVQIDYAEDALNRKHTAAFQGYVKSAEKQFSNIFKYNPGKADPEHPTLVELQKRIDALNAEIKKPEEDPNDPGPNIMRYVNATNVELDKAEDALNRNHAAAFQDYMISAEKQYANIFKYNPGKVDPEHPTLVELQKRIDALHAGVNRPDEDKDSMPEVGAER